MMMSAPRQRHRPQEAYLPNASQLSGPMAKTDAKPNNRRKRTDPAQFERFIEAARKLHRARDRLVAERTALINQLRAILLERGITVPQGRTKLGRYLAVLVEDIASPGIGALTPRMRSLIEDMRAEWGELDRRIMAFEEEFTAHAREDEAAR